MYDLRACRACLKQNCKLGPINDTTRRVYCTITGLDFTPGDSYPSYFCAECSTQIRKILAFRRRCRRAFSVLKEICAVRKKVTLADLSIIDRKKTNLTSNIDNWRNNNTFFYFVDKVEETDTKPAEIKEFDTSCQEDIKPYVRVDTTKYKPEVINNTFIAVDIRPADCEGLDDETNDVNQKVEYPSDGDIDINDDMVGYDAPDEDVTDVDSDHVVEGLTEEKRDDDCDRAMSGLPEPEPEEKIFCGMQLQKAFTLSQTLVDFTIQVLSFEEQTASFKARKEVEPYKSAGFKCAMCLIVYPDISELLKHVKLHNKKQKQLSQEQRRKYQCAICKDSFAGQAQLTAHSACYHWYKYHCKRCKENKYTLFDTLKCHKRSGPVSVSSHYTMVELFSASDMTSQEQLTQTGDNCRYCGWRVDGKQALEDHEKSHVEGRYQCDMCGLWCRLKVHLEHHMHTHYRIFTCKRCDKVFEGWNAAHDHLKDHEKLKCSNCEQTFGSELERSEHQAEHTSDSKLDCNLCGLSVYGLSQMYYHQLANHGYISINHLSLGASKYRCAMCGDQFADEADLKTHKVEQGHVEADTLGGKCESCKKVFATVGEFVAHRRGNTVCRRYPVKCAYCDEMLTNYYMSKRHYEQTHPTRPNEHLNAMQYTVCELCGKNIVSVNIKKHLKRHATPVEEPRLTCKLCRHRMYTSRAYVSHMLFNHTPKPYMCAQCPYRAKHRSECRDHILKVHAPELLYSCQKCTRRFSHLDLLQSHSVKAHGVSGKEERVFYRPLKDVVGKVSVFPHMKIDGSLIPPAVIQDTELYLYDYLCKSRKLVDWRDYYVFGTGVEPTESDPNVHRKKVPKKPPIYKKRVRWQGSRKAVNDTIIKAVESQNFDTQVKSEVKEKQATKRIHESDVIKHVKVKMAKLNETVTHSDVNADDDNVEHEMILLQADTLEGPSEADPYIHSKKPQKRSHKTRDRRKPSKPVDEVIVKAVGRQSFKMVSLDEMSSHSDENTVVENVEHEEMVQGYDMPDLQADVLEDPNEVNEAEILVVEEETSEGKSEDLDMSQLLNEHYEIIEESGEQYVVVNGNLYKLQIGA